VKWTLKLGLYGVAVVGFFAVATVALPVIWVVDKAAGAYRKLST
jgi:hypothetical protein